MATEPKETGTKDYKPPNDDTSQSQWESARDKFVEDPEKNPPPQMGFSSSELNSAAPDVKEAATEEAADAPHNNPAEATPRTKEDLEKAEQERKDALKAEAERIGAAKSAHEPTGGEKAEAKPATPKPAPRPAPRPTPTPA
jgi:hypothetical protein